MPVVYRIETPDGTGIYRKIPGFNRALWECGEDADTNHHPGPSQDKGLRGVWDVMESTGAYSWYQFGFSSIRQLRKWTRSHQVRAKLAEYGFRVRKYHAPSGSFIRGEHQAIFIKRDAECIGDFDPSIY